MSGSTGGARCYVRPPLTGYICRGLREGFRIGFKREVRLKSTNRNMELALQHPEVVTEYIEKDCALGRMLGLFPTTKGLPLLHISRFGVIPKGHNTGKFRLITDLSHPAGNSINDGLDPHLCSLTYTSVEEVAAEASRSGQGALLVKVDIEAAYRLVPVHPQDRVLQAVKWDDAVFIDPMLPFGLRSAPKIFNAVADALQRHLIQAGVERFHYLDDYILVGPPHSQVCQTQLQILLDECARLGVPIADHKTEGPATKVTFLGIVIDTVKEELRLPQDKLTRLTSLLAEWQARKNCTRKELESLIGLLNHACKVVRPGRPFLRRMIDLLQAVHRPPNSRVPIRLAHGFRADLAWWVEFVVQWNGTSFLHPPSSLPKVHLYTDASGSWGCGTLLVSGQMGCPGRGTLNCREGAYSHHSGMPPGLGGAVEGRAGHLPLRQSVGSGRLDSLEQTQGHDAPVAYSGVRGGQAGMLLLASLH